MLVTAAGVSHGDYRSGDLEADRKRLAGNLEQAAVPGAGLVDLDLDSWRRVLDVNLTGTLLAVRAAAALMLERKRPGSIVTIASVAALDPLLGAPLVPGVEGGRVDADQVGVEDASPPTASASTPSAPASSRPT